MCQNNYWVFYISLNTWKRMYALKWVGEMSGGKYNLYLYKYTNIGGKKNNYNVEKLRKTVTVKTFFHYWCQIKIIFIT